MYHAPQGRAVASADVKQRAFSGERARLACWRRPRHRGLFSLSFSVDKGLFGEDAEKSTRGRVRSPEMYAPFRYVFEASRMQRVRT